MCREEVILLQVIQHLPASTDRIHTEVLKAILCLQAAVWKDPVHLHMAALLQAAAGHTAVVENPEVLIPDLHLVLHQAPRPAEAVLHPAVAVDPLQAAVAAGVNLKQ